VNSDPQPLLQRDDVPADRPLRHGEFTRRHGDAAVAGDRLEGLDGVEIGQSADHRVI
jgi:hypothetical protein